MDTNQNYTCTYARTSANNAKFLFLNRVEVRHWDNTYLLYWVKNNQILSSKRVNKSIIKIVKTYHHALSKIIKVHQDIASKFERAVNTLLCKAQTMRTKACMLSHRNAEHTCTSSYVKRKTKDKRQKTNDARNFFLNKFTST